MVKKEQNLNKIKFKKFLRDNSFALVFMGIILFIVIISLIVESNNSNTNVEIVYGDDVIDMYYFHLSTCPHCHEQNKFNKILQEKYPNLRINSYELTQKGSVEKYLEFAQNNIKLDPNNPGTPTTVIGDKSNVGFGTPETTGNILISMIESEMERINSNWDESTMKRTVDLRK